MKTKENNNNYLDMISVLRRWAVIGKKLRVHHTPKPVSWNICHGLLHAADQYTSVELEKLDLLVKKTENQLKPLQEPLKLNLGVHRWLSKEREEAYSDWFAWTIQELATPDFVAEVFYGEKVRDAGITDVKKLLACKAGCTVDREVWIPQGHQGQAGRLDCLIKFGNDIIIVAEIKMGSADDADTEKQKGYSIWLEQQEAAFKKGFLIATDGKVDDYCGFQLLLWRSVCKRLRKFLPELNKQGRIITSALIAGFACAVEQNILGLPSLEWLPHYKEHLHIARFFERAKRLIKYFESMEE